MAEPVMATVERAPGAVQLRPYQQEAIEAIERAAERGVRRPLLVLPTGAGKTLTFASLIERRGGAAIVLAHRDELLQQAAAKIRAAHPELGLAVGFVAAEWNDCHAPVVVGSVQTLERENRLAQLPREFTTVVVDESHRSAARSYRKILNHLSPSSLILGVTATPFRSDGKQLSDVWEEVVYQRGIVEMIPEGYLCDVRGVRVELQVDLDQVRQAGGDFDQEQLGEVLEADAPEHAVRAYKQHAQHRRALLFAPTVKLARTFAAVFRERGIPAEAVDGTTPAEVRAGMFERIQSGETRVLANVAVATEGLDLPAVDAIVMACPTRSQVKYQQAVGRSLRTHPGKQDAVIIDLVGVTERLELQTLPRLFGLCQQPAAEVSAIEALEQQQAKDHQEAERRAGKRPEAPKGTLRSREVQLLGRKRRLGLRWLQHERHWLLSVGEGGVLALAPAGGRYDVLLLGRQETRTLASGLDLGYAHGLAEDFVRQTGVRTLTAPHARWRTQPVSPGQVGKLKRLGLPVNDAMTKGQASDLIAMSEGVSRLRRLRRAG